MNNTIEINRKDLLSALNDVRSIIQTSPGVLIEYKTDTSSLSLTLKHVFYKATRIIPAVKEPSTPSFVSFCSIDKLIKLIPGKGETITLSFTKKDNRITIKGIDSYTDIMNGFDIYWYHIQQLPEVTVSLPFADDLKCIVSGVSLPYHNKLDDPSISVLCNKESGLTVCGGDKYHWAVYEDTNYDGSGLDIALDIPVSAFDHVHKLTDKAYTVEVSDSYMVTANDSHELIEPLTCSGSVVNIQYVRKLPEPSLFATVDTKDLKRLVSPCDPLLDNGDSLAFHCKGSDLVITTKTDSGSVSSVIDGVVKTTFEEPIWVPIKLLSDVLSRCQSDRVALRVDMENKNYITLISGSFRYGVITTNQQTEGLLITKEYNNLRHDCDIYYGTSDKFIESLANTVISHGYTITLNDEDGHTTFWNSSSVYDITNESRDTQLEYFRISLDEDVYAGDILLDYGMNSPAPVCDYTHDEEIIYLLDEVKYDMDSDKVKDFAEPIDYSRIIKEGEATRHTELVFAFAEAMRNLKRLRRKHRIMCNHIETIAPLIDPARQAVNPDHIFKELGNVPEEDAFFRAIKCFSQDEMKWRFNDVERAEISRLLYDYFNPKNPESKYYKNPIISADTWHPSNTNRSNILLDKAPGLITYESNIKYLMDDENQDIKSGESHTLLPLTDYSHILEEGEAINHKELVTAFSKIICELKCFCKNNRIMEDRIEAMEPLVDPLREAINSDDIFMELGDAPYDEETYYEDKYYYALKIFSQDEMKRRFNDIERAEVSALLRYYFDPNDPNSEYYQNSTISLDMWRFYN